MAIAIWQAPHTASTVSGRPVPSVLLNVAGSRIGGCKGKKEKREKDPLKAAGGWVELMDAREKRKKERGRIFGMLLAIGWKGKKKKEIVMDPLEGCWELGGGNDGCEGKKEKREGQIF